MPLLYYLKNNMFYYELIVLENEERIKEDFVLYDRKFT